MKLEQATEIINKLKNKELKEWCKVNVYRWKSMIPYNGLIIRQIANKYRKDFLINLDWEDHIHGSEEFLKQKCEIIWHPFTYWHAIDWIEKNERLLDLAISRMNERREKIYWSHMWKDKRKDIEAEENKEALFYLAELIKELWATTTS